MPVQLAGLDDDNITIRDFARFIFGGYDAPTVGNDQNLIARVAMRHITGAIVESHRGHPQVGRIEFANQLLAGDGADHDWRGRDNGGSGIVFDQFHGYETHLILKDVTRKAGKSE